MQLEQSFEVEAPIDQVWAALVDVERVTPCLPGAAVTGRNPDGTYNGTFTIKIGPTTASYTGKLEMQNLDESTHRATMHAQGTDRRGQGGAVATITSTLSEIENRTLVQVMTDYHITGRLARFGRGGMIEDISHRLLKEFAGRLQASLTYSGGSSATSASQDSGEEGTEQPTQETTRVSEAPWAGPVGEGAEAERPAPEPAPAEAPTQAWPTPAGVDEGPEAASASSEEAAEPATEPEPPAAEAAPAEPPIEPVPPAEVAEEVAPLPPEVPEPPAAEEPAPPPPPEAEREAPPPEAEPAAAVDGLSLVGGALVDRVKRNPAPLLGIVGGLLVLRLLVRRR